MRSGLAAKASCRIGMASFGSLLPMYHPASAIAAGTDDLSVSRAFFSHSSAAGLPVPEAFGSSSTSLPAFASARSFSAFAAASTPCSMRASASIASTFRGSLSRSFLNRAFASA